MSETSPSPQQPKLSRCKYCHEEIVWKRDIHGFPFPEKDGIDHRMNCSYMEKIRDAIGNPPALSDMPTGVPKMKHPPDDIMAQFRRIDNNLSYVRKMIDPILSGECEDAIIITVLPNGVFRNAFVGDPRRAVCYLEETKQQILNQCFRNSQTKYFDEEEDEDGDY